MEGSDLGLGAHLREKSGVGCLDCWGRELRVGQWWVRMGSCRTRGFGGVDHWGFGK